MVDPGSALWPLPRQLVLVVGCPRSGVCFGASQLARHPQTLLLDGHNGLAEAWLRGQLADAPPEAPGSPTPLGGANLRESAQLALGLIYNPAPAAPDASHLVLPLPKLLAGEPGLALLRQAAAHQPRPLLLEMVRDSQDVMSSLARFPHLSPDLPDPWGDPLGFQAAAQQLRHHCRQAAQQLRQDGLIVPTVRYEALVERGPELIWTTLGLNPADSGQAQRLHGISSSLCFRERRLDRTGLGRSRRQSSAAPSQAPCAIPAGPTPLIATGRGGSGTRLLTLLLEGLGVHLGHSLNPSGDSVEWADLIYELCLSTLAGHPGPWRGDWNRELRHRALCVAPAAGAQPWGWKLPEAMLVLPQLSDTWPDAPIVHLVRHPVDACLRRSHMTSRVNNPIGSGTLKAAFATLGLNDDPASTPDYWRNAVSWWYQLELLQRCKATSSARGQRWIELRYEDICAAPQRQADHLADQLGLARRTVQVPVNPARSHRPDHQDPRAGKVWDLCGPLARLYGYEWRGMPGST